MSGQNKLNACFLNESETNKQICLQISLFTTFVSLALGRKVRLQANFYDVPADIPANSVDMIKQLHFGWNWWIDTNKSNVEEKNASIIHFNQWVAKKIHKIFSTCKPQCIFFHYLSIAFSTPPIKWLVGVWAIILF